MGMLVDVGLSADIIVFVGIWVLFAVMTTGVAGAGDWQATQVQRTITRMMKDIFLIRFSL